mmetsp:Transcript_21497/g.83396  ORF Transcript_21497/g.83396 Transcript_21497/m.83396 type:complete len:680 (+) Transcript_21497:1832-3871(+)
MLAGVDLVQENVDITDVVRLERLLSLAEGVDDLLLARATVDVKHVQRDAQPAAEVADQHRLAAAGLAHQHHGDAAAHAYEDGQHLEQRVAGQAAAALHERVRLLTRALHLREAAQHLMVALVEAVEVLADVDAVLQEAGLEAGVHPLLHALGVQAEEADLSRHVGEEQALVVAVVPAPRRGDHLLHLLLLCSLLHGLTLTACLRLGSAREGRGADSGPGGGDEPTRACPGPAAPAHARTRVVLAAHQLEVRVLAVVGRHAPPVAVDAVRLDAERVGALVHGADGAQGVGILRTREEDVAAHGLRLAVHVLDHDVVRLALDLVLWRLQKVDAVLLSAERATFLHAGATRHFESLAVVASAVAHLGHRQPAVNLPGGVRRPGALQVFGLRLGEDGPLGVDAVIDDPLALQATEVHEEATAVENRLAVALEGLLLPVALPLPTCHLAAIHLQHLFGVVDGLDLARGELTGRADEKLHHLTLVLLLDHLLVLAVRRLVRHAGAVDGRGVVLDAADLPVHDVDEAPEAPQRGRRAVELARLQQQLQAASGRELAVLQQRGRGGGRVGSTIEEVGEAAARVFEQVQHCAHVAKALEGCRRRLEVRTLADDAAVGARRGEGGAHAAAQGCLVGAEGLCRDGTLALLQQGAHGQVVYQHTGGQLNCDRVCCLQPEAMLLAGAIAGGA